jgi:hypothetical protein
MKIYRLIVICLCAGFTLIVSADESATTDNSSRAADLARQANDKLQDASSRDDFLAAAALLEKSVALNPDDLDVRQTLGWVYLDQLHEPRKAYPQLESLPGVVPMM